MHRIAARSSARALRSGRASLLTATPRRSLGTAPAARKGTWRGAAVKWGLAFGALYWYNTSPVFAEEPAPRTVHPPPQFVDADLPTVEAVVEEKRKQADAKAAAQAPAPPEADAEQQAAAVEGKSPEELEEEAGQQGAFNPETGEINWDCPCLGGMASGPCGEEFKAAFSCFVHSTDEPKGMDCIDKFQHMQDCFRKYPDIYGSELDDDDEGAEPPAVEGAEGDPPVEEPSKRNLEQPEDETKEHGKDIPQAKGQGQAPVPAQVGPTDSPRTEQPKAVTDKTLTPKEQFDATETTAEKK